MGDPISMPAAHGIASGMGGMRTSGDLVARMQMTRGMPLRQAKEHVAAKIGVTPFELSDPVLMGDVRGDLGIGRIMTAEMVYPEEPTAMEAKFRIAELLDIPINCVERFKERTGVRR